MVKIFYKAFLTTWKIQLACTLCQLCGKIAGQWAKQWGQSAICHLSGKRAWECTANNSGGEAAKPWHVN